jgi:hypothetical protein
VDAHRARLKVKMKASSAAELGALHALCADFFGTAPLLSSSDPEQPQPELSLH